MKKVLIVLILLLCIVPGGVEAHTLKTSGSIGAVLHVDPDDAPHANDNSTLFLDFHDRANKFTFDKCNCVLTIALDGKTLYSENFQNLTLDGTSIGTSYVFPKAGVYQIKVDGKPLKNSEFKAFHLVYDMRVEADGVNVSSEADYSKYIVPAILTVAALFLLVYYWRNRK